MTTPFIFTGLALLAVGYLFITRPERMRTSRSIGRILVASGSCMFNTGLMLGAWLHATL